MKNFPRALQHGSGATMTLEPTRLLLAFSQPISRSDVEARLRDFGLALEDAGDTEREQLVRPFEVVNHTDRRFWAREVAGRSIDQDRFDALWNALAAQLEWIGPVYRLGETEGRGGLVCPLPNVLLVRPAAPLEDREDAAFKRRLRGLGLKEDRKKSDNLGPFNYYELADARERTAYQLHDELLGGQGVPGEVDFETMPMVVPLALVPNDTLFPQQWSMVRIQAGGAGATGWDISTGAATVVVSVLDQGCDLGHPDLTYAPGAAGQGINLGTMMPTGAPTGPHGTACAGLALGTFNNNAGVSGVAGSCRLMPVAFQNWTDAECAAGINWAANNGAHVISMSFGVYAPGDGFAPTGWNFAIIDPAITNAVNVRGSVLIAATGNENTGIINRYPGRHPLVVAVGGSDQADNRKTPASADGECWGASFGPGISVVAPCVLNPTTDNQGAGGYNVNNGGPVNNWACMNYPICGDAAGNYFFQFNGTSSATPHVAGLAAAIRSHYATLTNVQVRNLIERTADKVGGAYADAAGFPNGTRNAQMGYGRINMLRALDLGDVLIKDWTGDNGIEPSTPPGGNFWSFSDIVVRITDDGVFNPGDPLQSSNVERGQTNYLYIRATNNGPRDARNVVVNARITPYVGSEFVYPTDWTTVDANHVSPTPVTATFASIAAGTSATAKFTISSTQVDTLWGWISGMNWHPCLLASVTSDNDYAFASASVSGSALVVRRNNLAQRNLSVIDVLATAAVAFPFLAGHPLNAADALELLIDRSRIPHEMPLLLALEDDGAAFPLVDLTSRLRPPEMDEGLVFLERTHVETILGCCRGVLTLEKGSRFDCPPARRVGKVQVRGGEVILRDGKHFVDVREDVAIVRLEKRPHQMYPFSLHTTIPAEARGGDQYIISVAQRNEREEIVGGASAVYVVR
jgi:Subtilase family